MKKSIAPKIVDRVYTDLAEQVLFGRTFNLDRTGLVLKTDKSISDVSAAAKKAMSTAPFKTEAHIVKMADYLRKLTCPAIPI
jgi:hypothetical protein